MPASHHNIFQTPSWFWGFFLICTTRYGLGTLHCAASSHPWMGFDFPVRRTSARAEARQTSCFPALSLFQPKALHVPRMPACLQQCQAPVPLQKGHPVWCHSGQAGEGRVATGRKDGWVLGPCPGLDTPGLLWAHSRSQGSLGGCLLFSCHLTGDPC